jgi:hypothetical protein
MPQFCVGTLAHIDSLRRHNQTLENIPLLQKKGFFTGPQSTLNCMEWASSGEVIHYAQADRHGK